MASDVRTGRQEELIAAGAADTIFAPATGRPPAAIAIVRMSGPDAWAIAERIAGPLPAIRQASLRRFRNPSSERPIDRGLLLLLDAGGSPTGEPIAEFHVHGGRAVIDAMTALLTRCGARAATAGEFTWRGFLHGKQDLTRVEGLADLLAAETEGQRRAALRMADGDLADRVAQWRGTLLAIAADVEALIDFSDEDDVRVAEASVDHALEAVATDLGRAVAFPTGERLHDGIVVGIAGPPNSGKSTLLNALVGREAAIVSGIAGTTRDVIEVPVTIAGIAMRLVDMAGLRDDTGDEIERIGIERARHLLRGADLVVWLGDDRPPEAFSQRCIAVHARADLPRRERAPSDDVMAISARTGVGLESLARTIADRAGALLPADDAVALSRRQHEHLTTCHGHVREAIDRADVLLRAESLRAALGALDRLVGRDYVDDLLGALFSRFCIGK